MGLALFRLSFQAIVKTERMIIMAQSYSYDQLAAAIEHTFLKPEATREQIQKLCQEALTFRMGAVCLNPRYVSLAAGELQGSPVQVCTVIGFPLGANLPEVKRCEAERAVAQGAQQLDMVIDIGGVKEQNAKRVWQDIEAVLEGASGRPVKVIIETCLLTDAEKRFACQCAVEVGAAFVKTSTGFAGGGATVADVSLMRQVVGNAVGVKASGGIKTLADAIAMLKAGANRLGTSAGAAILQELAQG